MRRFICASSNTTKREIEKEINNRLESFLFVYLRYLLHFTLLGQDILFQKRLRVSRKETYLTFFSSFSKYGRKGYLALIF